MNLMQFEELTFQEKQHIYRLGGTEIPSVSKLMEPLSGTYYQSVDPAYLNKAASRGTAVHNAAENYLLFGIEDIEPEHAGYLEAFKQWVEDARPKVIATEFRVYHKILMYAGTLDLICEIDGKTTIVDYKTTNKVSKMLCPVQLEAYDRALESHGIKVDDRFILHLSKDGEYEEVDFKRSAKHWSVFSSLMTIYNYKNEK